jgi:hypothetical protein
LNPTAGRDFLIGLTSLVLSTALIVVLYLALDHLQERTCPAGTFLHGWTNLGGAFTFLPWLFAGLLCSCTVLRVLVYQLTPADQPFYTIGSACTLILAVALSLYGARAGFCAWPEGLSLRQSTFAATKTYAWKDVRRIEAVCLGYYRSKPRFILILSDDAQIDLFDAPRSLAGNLSVVENALKSVPFVYDNSAVLPNCSADLKEFLLQGPHGILGATRP